MIHSSVTNRAPIVALTCAVTPQSCIVTFPGPTYTDTPGSGDYYLEITYGSQTLLSNSVAVAQLSVTGNLITRTTPTLLRQTVTFGKYRYHRVLVGSSKTLTVTLPYIDTNQKTYYQVSGFVKLVL